MCVCGVDLLRICGVTSKSRCVETTERMKEHSHSHCEREVASCLERTLIDKSYITGITGGCQLVGISIPPFQRQEPSEDAIRHVLQEVKARVDQLTGKETVNLVWAFSKMQAGAGGLGLARRNFSSAHEGLRRTECGWPR